MDTQFEQIVPWNGEHDTGREVRLKLERNWRRVATGLEELLQGLVEVNGALDGKLSKNAEDTATALLTFLKGLHVGEAVDSLTAGRGTLLTPDGRIQTDRLEVRSSLAVRELLVNRLTAAEGDYQFTDTGTIDAVTPVEDADNTYLLQLRKHWEFDFTALDVHDVVYGSVNTLQADGSYLTSWCRVLEKDASANTLTVALYPDSEVPGGVNYAPTAGMTLARRGNAVNEERQSCWYISSREGVILYLEGVTKPILEESNYYLSIGRPKHLELFKGLPINYNHPYLFARGAVIQDLLRVDFAGTPVYDVIDAGAWDATTQYIRGKDAAGKYIVHQVWYKSCLWRCAATMATVGTAPRWNNTQWVCIVGADNYTLSIISSRGRFLRIGQEYTQLSYTLLQGNMDISADAARVEWTRESNLPAEDALWNIEHAAAGTDIDITPADMPSNWYEVRRVTFRVKVALREGDEPVFNQAFTIN
jgi:hypothetical protein